MSNIRYNGFKPQITKTADVKTLGKASVANAGSAENIDSAGIAGSRGSTAIYSASYNFGSAGVCVERKSNDKQLKPKPPIDEKKPITQTVIKFLEEPKTKQLLDQLILKDPKLKEVLDKLRNNPNDIKALAQLLKKPEIKEALDKLRSNEEFQPMGPIGGHINSNQQIDNGESEKTFSKSQYDEQPIDNGGLQPMGPIGGHINSNQQIDNDEIKHFSRNQYNQ